MTLRLFSLFVITLLAAAPASAFSPVHAWSQRYGDASDQYSFATTVDGAGNIIQVGYFYGSVDFGGGLLTSAGDIDISLAKFDPAGNHLWSQSFGDAQAQQCWSVTVDGSDNVLISGSFTGTVNFGGGNLVSAGSDDIFVAKFDPAGNFVWSQSFGATDYQYAYGIATDGSDNVVVIGNFRGTVDFGGGGLTSAGNNDLYVVKFDPAGNHLWSQRFGDALDQQNRAVATDASGNILMTGHFQGAVDFGGGLLTSAGTNDAFVAKFDAAGAHLWSQRFGDSDDQYSRDVEVDGSGNVLLVGYHEGTIDFGGGPLTSTDTFNDIFVAKFDPAGAHLWSQNFPGTGHDYAVSGAVDAADNFIITGYFQNDIDLGGGVLTATGWDIFVARLDPTGAGTWVQKFGGADNQFAYGAAVDARGNVIVAGHFAGSVDFGGGTLTSAGGNDIFVAKFWTPPAIHSVLDVPGDQGGQVNLAWYGCGGDNPAEQAITEYTLWRALPTPAYEAMVEDGATVSTTPPVSLDFRNDAPYIRVEQTANATYFWYLVGTVQAYYLSGYSAPIPTLNDSTSADPGEHYFQVIAHTSDPGVFFVSDPDTGYSVDNLPPAMVINLVGEQSSGPGGLTMTWSPNTELDLDHYAAYRGTTPGFVPGPGNLLATPTDPSLDDGGWTWNSGYYYKVAAVDEHENEGPPALLGPGFVTGVTPLEIPKANYLAQNVPNPFNPTTTITFGLKKAADVTLKIYDASGQLVRTLVDGLQPAGPNEVTWYGKDDAQKPVASGVYFYRLEVGSESFSRKLVFLK